LDEVEESMDVDGENDRQNPTVEVDAAGADGVEVAVEAGSSAKTKKTTRRK
jgi:hypothetical protein